MNCIDMVSVNSENPIKERLLNAIQSGDFKSFKNELISQSEDFKMFSNELLLICCESSDKDDFVNELLSRGDVDVNYYDEMQKKAPIHIAVMNECENIVQLLLRHPQIDVNILDGDENSPLHLAAIAGNIECTSSLLYCEGIKTNILNKEKQSPIYLASKSNKNNEKLLIEYLRYFLVDSEIEVQENQLIAIKEVLKNCPTQIRALYYLYRKLEDDFISLLSLENQGNLKDGNDGYSTHLQFACSWYLPKVVQALLKHGANPNGRVPQNRSYPLFIASYYGYADIVQIFLDSQNPEIIYQMYEHNTEKFDNDDIEYTSALHEVIHGSYYNDYTFPDLSNYHRTFELLLPVFSKLEINYVNFNGVNCLHLAGCINNQYYVHSLLDCGAYLGDCGAYKGKIDGESPLSDISYNVLESYLNKRVSENSELTQSDENYYIACEYKFLCPPKIKKLYHIGHQVQLDEESIDLQNIPEIEPLLIISKIPELKALLSHPVLIAFFHLKWSKIQKYFYTDLIFYFGFLSCLTFYTLCSLQNNDNQYCSIVNYSRVPILLYLMYLIIRELYQIIFFRLKYVKNFENWLEISLILSTLILMYEVGFKEIRDPIYVTVILISWIEFMFILSKCHTFAVQFTMFKVIFENCFNLLRWYSVLIIAFILSFYVVVKDDKKSESRDLYSVSFKTIMMVVGDFNVGDDSVVGRILVIFFILLVSIVLVNTLNGLAVGDIAKVQRDAEIISLQSRMHLIRVVELFFINMRFFTNMCCFRFCRVMTRWLDVKVTIFPDALNCPIINIYPNQNNRVEFNPSSNTRKGCISSIRTFNLDNECVLRAKMIIKNNKIESKKIEMEKKNDKSVITKWIHESKKLLKKEKEKENNEENMKIIYKAVGEINEIIKLDDKIQIKEKYFNALFENVEYIKNMLITKNT